MLKFLKKNEKAAFVETAVKTNQSTRELIEEIHETFFSEVERLLASAKIQHPVETNKQSVIEKSERLKKLGFHISKDVIEAEAELKRMETINDDNKKKSDLVEAINYFSFKYPTYRFITEESVKHICDKYGLVYGSVSMYKGDVPDANLVHIEKFAVSDDDECYEKRSISLFSSAKTEYLSKSDIAREREKEVQQKLLSDITDVRLQMQQLHAIHSYTSKSPLEIAAPQGDFEMTGMDVKDKQLVKKPIPDPIVLQPVVFKNQKHYLIVTAWGLEATDESVVNGNNN